MGALAFVALCLRPVAWHGHNADSLMRVNEGPLETELGPGCTAGLLEPEVKAKEFLTAPQGCNSSQALSLDSSPTSCPVVPIPTPHTPQMELQPLLHFQLED